ncbi:MAG: DUF3696 domain-containing protein [Bryobacteraceae bacterium]
MISSLRLRNFKGFLDQSFEFAPLTVLTGLNGSGKSSLLQALLLLRQSYDPFQLSRLILNGKLARLGNFRDALFESARQEEIAFEMRTASGSEGSWRFSFASQQDRVSEPSGGHPIVGGPLFGGEGFRFLSAERLGPRHYYGTPDDADPLGIQGEWTPHCLAMHGDQPIGVSEVHHSGVESAHLIRQTEAWVREICPGLRIHIDRDTATDLVKLGYSFEGQRDVSNPYRPTNVGFGVSYTLPIVVSILAARPGDLILLEGPEAHLHPRGQVKLAELMCRAARGGVQLIVETHSDHVMNGVRVAVYKDLAKPSDVCFYFFERGPDWLSEGVRARRLEVDRNGRVADWPEGFFDEMDRSLEILLTPRGEPPKT